MKFSIQSEGPVGVVSLEQVGDDVFVRVNGSAILALYGTVNTAAVAQNVATELGLTVRIDG